MQGHDSEFIAMAAEFGIILVQVRPGFLRCDNVWVRLNGSQAVVSGDRGIVFRGDAIDALRAIERAL